MPIVMIRTNLVYMAAKIYVIMFIGIVKVIHNNYMLPSKIKKLPTGLAGGSSLRL